MRICLENCASVLAIPNTEYPVWEILKEKKKGSGFSNPY